MLTYIIRRLLLIIPTLLGIMVVNFVIVQAAPGGPVEQMIARIKHADMDATSRVSGSGSSDLGGASKQSGAGKYRQRLPWRARD